MKKYVFDYKNTSIDYSIGFEVAAEPECQECKRNRCPECKVKEMPDCRAKENALQLLDDVIIRCEREALVAPESKFVSLFFLKGDNHVRVCFGEDYADLYVRRNEEIQHIYSVSPTNWRGDVLAHIDRLLDTSS